MSGIVWLLEKNKDIVKPAIINFLRRRKEDLRRTLSDVEQKLSEFREKYGDFREFESTLPNDFNSHEVWFEWKELIGMREEILKELEEIDRAIKEITQRV